MIKTNLKTQTITDILNGVCVSIKNVIPLNHKFDKANLLSQSLQLQFGVLIVLGVMLLGKLY